MTGTAPPNIRDDQRPRRSWSRWLLVATIAWAVLLVGLTYRSVSEDGPTVREQRSLAEAGPRVDQAVGALVAAIGADAVIELTVPRLTNCRVTPMLTGAELARGITVWTADGQARALLDRIAERLPTDYRAGVRVTDQGARLRADAGEFVTVTGRTADDGSVQLGVDTGCRPRGAGYPLSTSVPADLSERVEAERLLGAFGGPSGAEPELVSAPCPEPGQTVRTVRAVGRPPAVPTAPGGVLNPTGGDNVLVDTPEVYAYRTGPSSTVVEMVGDQVRVAVSTGCAAG